MTNFITEVYGGFIYPKHILKSFTNFKCDSSFQEKSAYFSVAGIETIPNFKCPKIKLKCLCV